MRARDMGCGVRCEGWRMGSRCDLLDVGCGGGGWAGGWVDGWWVAGGCRWVVRWCEVRGERRGVWVVGYGLWSGGGGGMWGIGWVVAGRRVEYEVWGVRCRCGGARFYRTITPHSIQLDSTRGLLSGGEGYKCIGKQKQGCTVSEFSMSMSLPWYFLVALWASTTLP